MRRGASEDSASSSLDCWVEPPWFIGGHPIRKNLQSSDRLANSCQLIAISYFSKVLQKKAHKCWVRTTDPQNPQNTSNPEKHVKVSKTRQTPQNRVYFFCVAVTGSKRARDLHGFVPTNASPLAIVLRYEYIRVGRVLQG